MLLPSQKISVPSEFGSEIYQLLYALDGSSLLNSISGIGTFLSGSGNFLLYRLLFLHSALFIDENRGFLSLDLEAGPSC